VPVPGGSRAHGGAFRIFGPGLVDPPDAEPSTITDFDGFVGLAFLSGTVTRTNTTTCDRTLDPPATSSSVLAEIGREWNGVYSN
jgi:hypothetical protein